MFADYRSSSRKTIFPVTSENDELFQLMAKRIELQFGLDQTRHTRQNHFRYSPLIYSPSISSTSFPLIKRYSFRNKRRWKAVGLILIFYFHLRKRLRLLYRYGPDLSTNYFRIRSSELLTAIHRFYLEPRSIISNCLSKIAHNTSLLDQKTLFQCAQTIVDQICRFMPNSGVLSAQSDESVFIYFIHCSFEEFSANYFWSIERHLLSLSYRKMKQKSRDRLDLFTTKFLVISSFIFRSFNKTILLKPVKYRLVRGQIDRLQWLNFRLLSSLLLYIGRCSIMYKNDHQRLPMPFPDEMLPYLADDQSLNATFPNLQSFSSINASKLSAWALEYAEQLQNFSIEIFSVPKRQRTFVLELD